MYIVFSVQTGIKNKDLKKHPEKVYYAMAALDLSILNTILMPRYTDILTLMKGKWKMCKCCL